MNQLEALRRLHHVQRRLLAISHGIDLLQIEAPTEMLDQTVTNVINAIDDATNAIATRIQALVENAGALSPEATAAFQVEIDKLKALGSDGTPASVTVS